MLHLMFSWYQFWTESTDEQEPHQVIVMDDEADAATPRRGYLLDMALYSEFNE